MTTGTWSLRDLVEAFIYALTLVVAGILLWLVIRRKPSVPVPAPVYRNVRSRRLDTATGSEYVVLECGHEIRVVHHHRQSWPCGECAEGQ
jgi:hypothetical protein